MKKKIKSAPWANRIVGSALVDPKTLVHHESNWRRHPQHQAKALAGAIEQIGFLKSVTVSKRTNKVLDGHLRLEQALGQGQDTIPVEYVDLTEEEELIALATIDPLAAMAEADGKALAGLLDSIKVQNEDLEKMLTELAENHPVTDQEQVETEVDEDEPEADTLDLIFKAPFPWFGGKTRVAKMVWKRFGNVPCYIEPFFGSGAVLLNRPDHSPDHVETVNDLDGMVCNVWRAIKGDPDKVAEYADWPVHECDLHARHAWLVGQKDSLQARLEGDPDYYDAKIAGWWLWGMACWIGSGFCKGDGPWQVVEGEDGSRELVQVESDGKGTQRKLVHLGGEGRGVNRQRVHLGGEGQGVNRQLVHLGGEGQAGLGECGLKAWMQALSERLRRVRFCCGDWTRVCGGKSGDALAHFFAAGEPCGVFLDPPYADTADRESDIYAKDSLTVAHDVREWCIAHGDDPRLRIALCGYEGEHQMPTSWECVSWKAHGGMSSVSKGDSQAKDNKFRERVWFSPNCLRPNN